MTEALEYFLWMYARAALWVAVNAALIRVFTRNARVTRAYVLAHLAALGLGAAADYLLVHYAPGSWLQLNVLQWIFTVPIVIFTVISVWIGSWERPMHASDVFMTLSAVVAWGLLVMYGWQSMWQCHVLGAWFVSAAAGSADLCAIYGPEWARRRHWAARAAGYAVAVISVYLLLPRTEL